MTANTVANLLDELADDNEAQRKHHLPEGAMDNWFEGRAKAYRRAARLVRNNLCAKDDTTRPPIRKAGYCEAHADRPEPGYCEHCPGNGGPCIVCGGGPVIAEPVGPNGERVPY